MNDKKTVEQEIRENANRYNAIVDHLTEGIVIVDEKMHIIEWNSAMEAIMGSSCGEVQGRTYDEVILGFMPPAKRTGEFKARFREKVMEILRTGIIPETGMENDIEIQCKDGSRKFIRQTIFVIPVGERFHIGCVTTDVTRRQEWEENLRQKEFRYRLLFESANDAIFLMDQRAFIECNRKAPELFGCRKEDLLGKSPAWFSPEIQPDGQPSAEKASYLIKAALEKESQSFYWQHKRADGTLFDAEVSLNEVNLDGKKHLQAIVRDVTERVRYEDRMRRFRDCLLTFGSDAQENINRLTHLCGEILEATCALYNSIQEEMLCSLGQWNPPEGFVSESRARGHICYDVITRKGPDVMVVRHLPDTPYYDSDPNVAKYNLKTYIGKAVYVAGRSVGSLCAVFQRDYIPDETDKYFMSVIASAIGVEEERKVVHDQLMKYTEELTEMNAAKDKFFSIIAHDLKSPFNAIMGFSDILTTDWNEFEEEERQHFIRNINSSAKNTFRLLENLLEWAMAQTGKIAFNPVPVDLSVIANDVIIFLREQAEKKQVRLFTAINYGTVVMADENMLRTVFRNLVSNAVKFSESGGSVRIYSEVISQGEPAREMIEVCIADNGIGIPAEQLPLLFRIGEKVRTLGTAQEKGTGLGLILCRELIEKNKGTIRAESVQGKGSKFCFTLPAEKG